MCIDGLHDMAPCNGVRAVWESWEEQCGRMFLGS